MNRTLRTRFAALALGLLLSAIFPGAAAAVVDVEAMPTSIAVPPGRTTPTYTIRWQLKKGILPVSSAEGVFRAPGLIIGTIPVELDVTTVVTEQLRIPRSVLQRARELGVSSIDYTRLWKDGSAPPGESDQAAVRVNFVGGLGGPFQVTRFELRFDDQSSLRMVPQHERFTAVANVNYSGAGVIDAVWEIAGPAQSRALEESAAFRILRRVRRRLDGSGRIFLESPRLPSEASGLHLVRLRFIEPDTTFELPVIRYFVLESDSRQLGGAPKALELGAPLHLASIDEKSPFTWRPVEDANAYQVELFAAPETRADATRPEAALESSSQREGERAVLLMETEPPAGDFVTGAVVPGDKTTLELTPPMRRNLRAGRSYFWRVRALSAKGAVIAESPVREVRMSPSARLGTIP